jgi:ribonuclease MRP protein subunit RMP1
VAEKRGCATGTSVCTVHSARQVVLSHCLVPDLYARADPDAALQSAFSQLAADNQYAALGVLLIGILAQVSVALGNLLEDLAGEEPHRGETAALSEPGAPQNAPGLELQADAALLEGNDLGVAVDRDWIRGMQEDTTSTAVTEPPTSAIDAMHDVGKQGKPQGRKRKKRGADEFDTLFSGLL